MLYSKDHEWIEIEGNTGTIGISNYAVEQLGDITYVEVPEIDTELDKDEVLCSIESVKAASDIISPMTGKVIEVNENLEDSPEAVNEDPTGKAWIAKIELSDLSEKDSLLSEQEYEDYTKGL